MNNKILNPGDAIVSTKRIEYLLEQILINTVGNRYQHLPEDERKAKINEVLSYVDEDMKSYVEGLPDEPQKNRMGSKAV